MLDWPISTKEAAKRAGIPPQVASILIRTHGIPTERLACLPKFAGLMPEGLERLREVAKPFAAKRKPVATHA